MANGSSIFIGTGTSLHINSVYGIPYIPTQTPRKQCIRFTKKVDSTKVIDVFGKVLGIKPRTRGYPFINGAFTDKDDAWSSLSKLRDHASKEFKETANHMIMGVEAWKAMNLEANTFATLPKYNWKYSGWKMFNKKPTINFRGLKCKNIQK